EFALVAPLFFLILFALFEFSRMNVIRHTADQAAYEAARLAMVPGASAAEAQAEAARLLSVAGARGATIDITPGVIDINTESVTVAIRVPMDQNALVLPRFTGSAVIQAQSTLRTERVESR
ncbi:MAG: TadE/TadG family type IV pilus assembly protein, partial [Planctomycetota bacterium]